MVTAIQVFLIRVDKRRLALYKCSENQKEELSVCQNSLGQNHYKLTLWSTLLKLKQYDLNVTQMLRYLKGVFEVLGSNCKDNSYFFRVFRNWKIKGHSTPRIPFPILKWYLTEYNYFGIPSAGMTLALTLT